MVYSTTKLQTVAECDTVLNRSNLEKAELEHRLGGIVLETNRNDGSLAQAQADLLSVNAQITGFTAAFNSLPEGPEKDDMQSKIRRLNDRKDNLEERLSKTGSVGLLMTEMHRGLIEKQVAEITAFITAVEARKAAL